MQHIKDVVKEQLERAGLKTEGKIEVKILTRRSAEEAGDQWLTEEDTKSFRELLINLLTGGTEEVYKEQKRQQELENNYRFVWGEKQEEAQSTAPLTPTTWTSERRQLSGRRHQAPRNTCNDIVLVAGNSVRCCSGSLGPLFSLFIP
ncbi:hypothetical protein SKAU_G00152430 [Synaphobranchus kaupii]|uniref:Uncharacterized protein n=1 Tax=Synaphobranchus kaupii TaxID=118154 RepID=A0A9Q1FGV7_SYNKA|nr:hypothetical protein SKAU_G00152430 [Synaphobranchus kaupii]